MSRDVLKGVHRRALGIGYDDEVMAKKGYFSGGDGSPGFCHPSPDTVALFDDFLGDLVADEWAYVEGDTGCDGALVTGSGGVFRLTGSETQGVASTASCALTQGLFLNWKADAGGPKNGRLRLSARVKLGTVTRTAEGGRSHVFVGFSDSGGAEFPCYDTGAGVISEAADLCGFLLSPGGDTGWSLVAAKSTAGDSGDQLAVADTGLQPTSNVYQTLELEIKSGMSDTGGRAHFWINGRKVGSINSPVGSAIALTPWIGFWTQDTGFANTLDIDYVALSQPRDTGL